MTNHFRSHDSCTRCVLCYKKLIGRRQSCKALVHSPSPSANRRVISLMSYMLRVTINERDPILLDMGQFWMPSLLSTIQAVKAAVKAGEALSNAQRSGLQRRTGASASVDNLKTEGGHGAVQMAAGPLSSHLCQKASSAVVASALGRGACCMTASDALYIHSIVAHPLHARSKLWRNDLNLKDNNQQIVKGYFAAPGKYLRRYCAGNPATGMLMSHDSNFIYASIKITVHHLLFSCGYDQCSICVGDLHVITTQCRISVVLCKHTRGEGQLKPETVELIHLHLMSVSQY